MQVVRVICKRLHGGATFVEYIIEFWKSKTEIPSFLRKVQAEKAGVSHVIFIFITGDLILKAVQQHQQSPTICSS